MTLQNVVNGLNQDWTDIYHLLHYVHQENISHQAVRLLQYLEKKEAVTVGDLSKHIGVSQNTASEHIKRLITKGFVTKKRSTEDERKVHVVLTTEGTEILYKHTRLDDEKLEYILNNLSSSEIKTIEKAFSLLSGEAKKCF